jgi:uncharacterized protein GlcG (DUF336 family)
MTMPVTYDEANAIIRAAHRHASSQGISVSAAVVDEGGLLQAAGRMDEASPASLEVAISKAANSAFARRNGEAFVTMQRERPANLEALSHFLPKHVIPGLGGVLLVRSNHVIGAVGVSGGTGEQDDSCAREALRVID